MCRLSGIIEIDGVTESGNIKVINHSSQEAYEIEVDTIIKTPVKDLMLALETGVHIRVLNITRIVGYYSRIQNFNKSKVGELRDRIYGRTKGGYYVNGGLNQSSNHDALEAVNSLEG